MKLGWNTVNEAFPVHVSHDAHTSSHRYNKSPTEEEDISSNSVLLNLSSRDFSPDDGVEVKQVTLPSSGNATAEVTGLQGINFHTV